MRRLRNHGFTMTEVVVAVGILGVAMLGISDLIVSGNKSRTAFEQSLELEAMMADIRMIFANSENCSKVLGKGYRFNLSLNSSNIFDPTVPAVSNTEQVIFMNKGIGRGLSCTVPDTGLVPPAGCSDPQVFAHPAVPKMYERHLGAVGTALAQNSVTRGYLIRQLALRTVPNGNITPETTPIRYGQSGLPGELDVTVTTRTDQADLIIRLENTWLGLDKTFGASFVERTMRIIVRTERPFPVTDTWRISGCGSSSTFQNNLAGVQDPEPGSEGCVNVTQPPGGGFTYCPDGTYSLYQSTTWSGSPASCWTCGKVGTCCGGGSATASSSLMCCPVSQ
jgi:prepilin-type N-terminal cleavage/methylation domain-containing protein